MSICARSFIPIESYGKEYCSNCFNFALADFEMSDAQRQHAATIETLVPSFKNLRIDLHSYMGDSQFWMIYFILLLPRLDDQDFDLLSSTQACLCPFVFSSLFKSETICISSIQNSMCLDVAKTYDFSSLEALGVSINIFFLFMQIIETRNLLLLKLQNKSNEQGVTSNNPDASVSDGSKASQTQGENSPSSDKEVTGIVNATKALEIDDDEEDTSQWLEEDDTDSGIPQNAQKNFTSEGDISFSDLEDDDSDPPHRPSRDNKNKSGGSNDWVKLNEGSGNHSSKEKARHSTSRDKDSEGESSDWLAVDEFD